MSSSIHSIDARGLECPRPVVLVRKAILELRPPRIEVLVDSASARSNVARFAATEGYSCGIAERGDGSALLSLSASAREPQARERPDETASPATPTGTDTVFISSDAIGAPPSAPGGGADSTLGRVLMRSFLFALTESGTLPGRIILMNSGVLLACEGSDSLVNLERLGARGVDILACGTCLQHYGLADSLRIGKVSNMYEIAECLLAGPVLSV